MDVKGHSGGVSNGNEQAVGNWKKGHPCYEVAKRLAELCSCVLWKIDFVNNEIGYLAEEIFKQNVEGETWVILTAYSKIQKKR